MLQNLVDDANETIALTENSLGDIWNGLGSLGDWIEPLGVTKMKPNKKGFYDSKENSQGIVIGVYVPFNPWKWCRMF